MPVKMAFSSSPYTAEGTLRKRANVQVGVTSTQEQMQTGAMPSFGGTGLMEGQWDARDANGLPAGSRFRDEDGVDRVKEPPADLLPVLLFLKDIIRGESIVSTMGSESNADRPHPIMVRSKGGGGGGGTLTALIPSGMRYSPEQPKPVTVCPTHCDGSQL